MAAYVISDVEMLDPELLDRYRALAPSTITQYGGRYLVRGGKVQTMEGDWKPKQIVIVEFPTMQRALEWYHSPEYAEALKVREKALSRDLIFVDGVPDTVGARSTGRASNSHPPSRESDA